MGATTELQRYPGDINNADNLAVLFAKHRDRPFGLSLGNRQLFDDRLVPLTNPGIHKGFDLL